MTSEDIADGVVAIFNAIAEKPITFEAVNTEEPAQTYAERGDFGVFVLPKAETETAIDAGDMCEETRTVSVVINGPLRDGITRRKCIELMHALRFALRETEIGDFRWRENETVNLWDALAVKDKRQYLGIFEATYFNFG